VSVSIDGLDRPAYSLRHRRLDEGHSNINQAWGDIADGRPWPSEDEWFELAAANELADFEDRRDVSPTGGAVTLDFDLPMPGVSLIELTPT
jgi:xylan 1,4-beta-xylosidase